MDLKPYFVHLRKGDIVVSISGPISGSMWQFPAGQGAGTEREPSGIIPGRVPTFRIDSITEKRSYAGPSQPGSG